MSWSPVTWMFTCWKAKAFYCRLCCASCAVPLLMTASLPLRKSSPTGKSRSFSALLWSCGIVEAECTTCPTQSLPSHQLVPNGFCAAELVFQWLFLMLPGPVLSAPCSWAVLVCSWSTECLSCPQALGFSLPCGLGSCVGSVCWDTVLVLGSSSSVTWGCCCFRSFIFVPSFCQFGVPQWDKGCRGCSAELQHNIATQQKQRNNNSHNWALLSLDAQ